MTDRHRLWFVIALLFLVIGLLSGCEPAGSDWEPDEVWVEPDPPLTYACYGYCPNYAYPATGYVGGAAKLGEMARRQVEQQPW